MSQLNLTTIAWCVGAAASVGTAAIEIQTEDVTRFYEVYEAAHGQPTAKQLQADCWLPGDRASTH